MALLCDYALGALALALLAGLLLLLTLTALLADAASFETHDCKRAIWEERQALRILRARYASGLVSAEEYRRLCYELQAGHEA